MKTYRIKTLHGVHVVSDERNHLLNADELKTLIEQLSAIRDQLTSEAMTADEYVSVAQDRFEQSVMGTAEFFLATSLYPITYIPGARRKANAQIYSGVYFLGATNRPQQLKIGQSSDIYARSKSLYHELGKPDVSVIAYIKSDHREVVESYVHRLFRPYQIEGEWFELPPVYAWLRQFVRGL